MVKFKEKRFRQERMTLKWKPGRSLRRFHLRKLKNCHPICQSKSHSMACFSSGRHSALIFETAPFVSLPIAPCPSGGNSLVKELVIRSVTAPASCACSMVPHRAQVFFSIPPVFYPRKRANVPTMH